MCCFADKPIHIALLVPLTGSWAHGHAAGAAALAVAEVNADETLLPRRPMETLQNQRCSKNVNNNLKACDKDWDGSGNAKQGRCTLAECRTFCERHTRFQCRFYSYESAENECYVFDDCKDLVNVHGYDTYPLDELRLPVLE